MFKLGEMTIKNRVFVVIMASSLLAVVIGSMISMVFSAQHRKVSLQRDLTNLAQMIADNCLVPLAYNIPEDAEQLLASLKRRQSIVHAVIHNADEKEFAIYNRAGNAEGKRSHLPPCIINAPDSALEDKKLHVWQPIMFEGRQIGDLHILDDMSEVKESIGRDMIIFSVVIMIVLIVAYAITLGLHSLISNPIGYLSNVAQRISSDGDYSVRAVRKSGGEIGVLVESFNDMLNHIQTANAKMEQLIKELEDKNIELERFTYTVSHDLKSPLITIKGFIGNLKKHIEKQDRQRVDRDIDRINNAADKMFDLLRDLLELSRVGRVIGNIEDIAFDKIVKEVLLRLKVQATGVSVHVDKNMPIVKVDTMRLGEVMQNLIENAIKFMGDQEHPEIRIGCRDNNGEKVFFVRDNGIGIESEYREKVFGLFEQLNQHIDGTGIGLTIVRRIIEMHGGRIWIEDGEGQAGTTICFTIDSITDISNQTENKDER